MKRSDLLAQLVLECEARSNALEEKNATLEAEVKHERELRRKAELAERSLGEKREMKELGQILKMLGDLSAKKDDAAVIAAINSLRQSVESMKKTEAKTYRLIVKHRDMNGDIASADVSAQ